MKSASTAAVLLLLSVYSLCFSFGYADAMEKGTAIPGLNAVSLGLGGSRAVGFGDALSVLTNPADIYRIPGTTFTMSIGPAVGSEDVEDSTGINSSNWISFGNLSAAVKFQATQELAIGAGIARISDFSYEGIYHIRNELPYADIVETHEMKVVGGLFESALGFSWRPTTWMNVGLSGGLRFGKVDYDSTFIDWQEPENDTLVQWSRDESTFCWHAGVMIPLSLSSIGISWASPSDLYDGRIAGGAILYTGESRQGAIGAEVEIVDPGDANALVARIIGQVSPSNSLIFRGAFSFSDRGDEYKREGLGLSFGTSIHFGRLILDGAFSWSTVDREGFSFGSMEPEDVKTSPSIVSLGLTWNI